MKSIFLTLKQVALVLVMYVLGALIIGTALFPCAMFLVWIWSHCVGMEFSLKVFLLCLGIACSYFLFGLTLMLVAGVIRMILAIQLKEGDYKIGSLEMLKWFFVNALFISVRTVFMDFMMLTPFCSLFYRMMGAKLGHNVQINSKNVADHSLLEIGDNSVIGGNATVIGHSFESKGLKLAKVRIGKNVIIGLNAVVMPGVNIGDGAVVAAGAIVPKQTIIEPRTVYYSPDRQVKKD
jgi:hypothetical protein